jgi:deazaflavin-dependent oxidoreductase (nitroreductase family)
MPNIRWLLALITRAQRWLYLKTGGAVGARFFGIGMLLLTNVGRRTGHQRITPLLYIDYGKDWVVVASNAGDAKLPAWWLNLRANPHARIQIRREHHEVVARQATQEEAERIWPELIGSYRWFEGYRKKAGREIPIVILERAAPAG